LIHIVACIASVQPRLNARDAQNLYRRGLHLSADDTRLIVGHTVPFDVRRITILNTPQ